MDYFSTPESTPTRSILKEINAINKVNKSQLAKNVNPLGADSDLSDTAQSPAILDKSDSDYKNTPTGDTTCSDLVSNFGSLGLNTPIRNTKTPRKLPPPPQNDVCNSPSPSSDDELFEECENSFDAPITSTQATTIVAENGDRSNNYSANLLDTTINFPSNIANSTAEPGFSLTQNMNSINETPIESISVNLNDCQSIEFTKLENKLMEKAATISISDMVAAESANDTVLIASERFEDVLEQIGASQTQIFNEKSKSVENEAECAEAVEIDSNQTIEMANRTIDMERENEANITCEPMDVDMNETVAVSDPLTVQAISDQNAIQSIDSNEILSTQPQQANNLNVTVDAAQPVSLLDQTVEIAAAEQHPSGIIDRQLTNLNETVDMLSQPEHPAMDRAASEDKPLNTLNHTVEIASTEEANVSIGITNEQSINLNVTVDMATQPDSIPEKKLPNVLNQTVEITATEELNRTNPSGVNGQLSDLNVTVDMFSQPLASQLSLDSKPSSILDQTVNIASDLNQTQVISSPPTVTESVDTNAQKPVNLNVTMDASSQSHAGNKTEVKSSILDETVDIGSGDIQSDALGGSFQSASNLNVTVDAIAQAEPLPPPPAQSESQSLLNVTVDTSNLMPMDSFALPQQPNTKPAFLNETVVVYKIPPPDVTFVAAGLSVIEEVASPDLNSTANKKTSQPKSSTKSTMSNDSFKVPVVPMKTTFAGLQNDFSISEDEFQSNAFVLNPNDFDFLLSKGSPSVNSSCRDSILEKFDPITGRRSIVPPPLAAPVFSSNYNIREFSTIVEADCSDSTVNVSNLSRSRQSTDKLMPTEVGIETKQTDTLVSLDTADISADQQNSSGGDNSQASSTTETYETASIGCGEPIKAATMSVGLIHDINMDNMKLVDQDIKEQPNLKMNDEQKVKQEIVSEIERKLKESEAREESLLRRITEKEKALNKMSAVVENYEKTMVEMISEREQLTQQYEKQIVQLKAERDSNFHHLTSLETTFSDLHVKYEKSKQLALEVKENEAKLVEKLEFCQQQMKLQEQRYDKLKNHALTQLEGANAKLEALNKSHANESKKLSAQLKKEEISRQSIMEQLAQKTKENEELVKICDELINNGADGS